MSQQIEKKNESKTSFYALVFDDNPHWAQKTKEYLTTKSSKIKVDIANNTNDATVKINSTSYDALLVDTNLKGPIQGDEWLLSKLDLIRTSHKYIITGYPNYIKDFTELEKNGIRVVIKAMDEEIEVLDDIIKESKKETRDKSDEIKREEETKLGTDLGAKIEALAKEAFLEWLETRKDQLSNIIWLGDKQFSIKKLSKEVSENSEVGQMLLKMFVSNLRSLIGLNRFSKKEKSKT